MAHDVFICYANEDRERAQQICTSFEARGMQCWIAPRDVPPGMPYAEAIIQAISVSRVVALIFSSNANASPHVLREVECAADSGIRIIPLRVEDVPPSGGMQYFIRNLQWLDVFPPPLQQHLERLCEAVQGVLEREVTAAAPPAHPDKQAVSAPPRAQSVKTAMILRKPRLLLLVGGVVALVALAFVIALLLAHRDDQRITPVPDPIPQPESVEEVYAITDVMVTDNAERVPDEYTGVSKSELTLPYIPEQAGSTQVGNRLKGSDVNEGIGGTTTSIWVKYELLPVNSDKKVLVDIEVRPWVNWHEDIPKEAGWIVANGKSGGIAGGLTTGGAEADPCGLAVKYQPLGEASKRILALSLSWTKEETPNYYKSSKFPDWVGLKGREVSRKQAGGDIQKGANLRRGAWGHPFVYLIAYVDLVRPTRNPR